MKVGFWGTRGSIPVSITASAVRSKLMAALTGSVGRDLTSADKINAYSDTQIAHVFAETRRFEEITRAGKPLEVISAWDGLEIEL